MSRRKWITFSGVVFLALVLLVVSPLALWAQTGRPPWSVAAYVFSDELKVVLGGPAVPTETNMAQYTAKRVALLRQLAQQEPNQEMEAVLVFNSFLSADETAALVTQHHLRAEEIYLAVPNMQGGGGATVFFSIREAYDNYVQGWKTQLEQLKAKEEELRSHGIDPSSVFERGQAIINGKAGIYAVRVRGRLADLAASLEGPMRLVDVFYAPEVEAMARVLRKPVRYVVSPWRPDGLR
jgi:hypothetical protein